MVELDNLNKNRETDKTQATKFLLPLLYTSSNKRAPFYLRKGIDNCYLYDDGSHIIVVYNITDDNTDLEEELKDDELFVESIDIKGANKVGYVFGIPEQHKQDVQLFKEGKYSQFSDALKRTILQFWGFDPDAGEEDGRELYGVLYLTDQGKSFGELQAEDEDTFAEGEYWMKPDMGVENFSAHYTKA